MPATCSSDQEIDELLALAHVSPTDSSARSWIKLAKEGAQAIAAGQGQQSLAKQNAPLDKVKRATDRLMAALVDLKRHHPDANTRFWGAVRANMVENTDVMAVFTTIGEAARDARARRIGRRPNLRKQHIVNLAREFCARFSPATPSSDQNNFFRAFAERFVELATGLPAETEGHGIDRQIRVALQRPDPKGVRRTPERNER